jgi:protein-disulfide isomerase
MNQKHRVGGWQRSLLRNIRRTNGLVLTFAAVAMLSLVAIRPAKADDANRVVATVGDHKITEKELDARTQEQLAALRSQEYEIKRQAIDSIADDYLLDQAAKKEGLSADQYMKKHLPQRSITAADARAYYDHNPEMKQRFPNYDQIQARLIQALQQQSDEQNRDALVKSLRKDKPVDVLLTPPRVAVSSSGHPELGPGNAPITIVEFSDFQCPFCKRAEPTLKAVREKYGDKVKLVYMDFPLSFHPNALPAANAGRCAGAQGKFWEYHDQLFADQGKLDPADLKATAKKVGLNTDEFDKCLDSNEYQAAIESDLAQGKKLGVDGTPSFFVNGRPMEPGAQPPDAFANVIDEELQGSHQKQASAR